MKDFARYKIFIVMGGFHLLAFIGLGYLIVTKFPDNKLAIFIEILLVFGMIMNYVFYRYFKKIYANIED
ncbi:hypothetical protein GCM10011351_01220 [Paraliobacillus quinghaiensis]|uniref:Uncharacterized protein n=1 Tax=Paraliobacillus quinghaiensis TaxID=470815 RepID=A0A917WPL8_9BACI|nr:hypothetical protein [Paraliobacillus quinghaiensis]GGM19138.1 hypothetical protein GCM10011351_01220 [Paraliobacillus quinghaiensis]